MESTTERLSHVLSRALDILAPLRTVPRFFEELQALLAESAAARLRIGVVGVTSSGKSTFINGLLGESLLPEDSLATTNIPVICRWGPRRKAIVCYEEETDSKLVEHNDDEVTENLLKYLCSEEGNPGNQKHIRRVELELPNCCLPPELEIIDTPGTDAQGLPGHEAVTLYRCLPIADIIVFMTNIQRRIQESEARLLRNVVDHDQRVLFVMARRDTERDDIEDGEVILSKEEKLQNREIAMRQTLAEFENLRDCGIFSVSSVLAKEARGDRSSSQWRTSNFDSVVTCFDNYAQSLEQLLASSRIERTRAMIESLVKRIKAQTAELADQFEVEATLASDDADRIARDEQEMRDEVDAVRQAVTQAFDPAALQLDAAAELASTSESDIAGVRTAMERLGRRLKLKTDAQQARIDELRERLRTKLAKLKLQSGRSEIQQRALHLDPMPDTSKRVKTWARPYVVAVPRTYWGGKLVDAVLGERYETRHETISYVDLAELKKDLALFVRSTAEMFHASAAEQCDLLLDLYVEPVTQEKEQRDERFHELSERLDVAEWLPELARQLKELHEQYFPAAELRIQAALSQSVAATTREPESGAPGQPPNTKKPINAVIARLWESIAIERFVQVARQAAGKDVVKEVLLLGHPEEVRALIAFLTRSRRGQLASATGENSGISNCHTIKRRSEHVRLRWFSDEPKPADLLETACANADAIAVAFEAGQPSLGVRLLFESSFFPSLAKFPQKVFYFYGHGAVFDTRLADLVTQVAPMVSRETQFGHRPWFIYEAASYDARYSNFLELSLEVKQNGGSDRDFVRLWRQERLPMRDPFRDDVLAQAFTSATVERRRAVNG